MLPTTGPSDGHCGYNVYTCEQRYIPITSYSYGEIEEFNRMSQSMPIVTRYEYTGDKWREMLKEWHGRQGRKEVT